MSLLQRIQDTIQDTTGLMIFTNRVFRRALSEINSAAPSYTANDLVRDVTQVWLRSLIVGMRLSRPLSDPLLPTVTISALAANIPGSVTLNGTVSITDVIPPGTLPVITPLALVGWTQATAAPTDASQVPPLATKPVIDADLDPLRQQITVWLQVPIGAQVEQNGVYQGFVMVGSAPVAVVTVRAL